MAERHNRCWVMATATGQWERLDTGDRLQLPEDWQIVGDRAVAKWVVEHGRRYRAVYAGNVRRTTSARAAWAPMPSHLQVPSVLVDAAEAELVLAALAGADDNKKQDWVTEIPLPAPWGPAARSSWAAFRQNLATGLTAYLRFSPEHAQLARNLVPEMIKYSAGFFGVPVGLPFKPDVTAAATEILARAWLQQRSGLLPETKTGADFFTGFEFYRWIAHRVTEATERRVDEWLAAHREPNSAPDAPIDPDRFLVRYQNLTTKRIWQPWAEIDDITQPRTTGRAEQVAAAQARRAARLAGVEVPLRRALVAECGSPSGYRRHRRNNEQPCAACRAAEAQAVKSRRQQPGV